MRLALNGDFDWCPERHATVRALAGRDLTLEVLILSEPHVLDSEVEDPLRRVGLQFTAWAGSLNLSV